MRLGTTIFGEVTHFPADTATLGRTPVLVVVRVVFFGIGVWVSPPAAFSAFVIMRKKRQHPLVRSSTP
jgi:hypothetical protein